jgi:7-carboxy-7-deazaguanine synthase
MPNDNRLKINEIFYSLQGEALTVGIPTTFIRLTGCPLRCQYCDTEYAFSGGDWMSLDAILERVAANQTRYVTVTGGEPLAQKPCLDLLAMLCDAGYQVSLETSGALDISRVDSRVVKVMDIKTPGSAEESRNRLENISCISEHDQLKFVICDERDYEWSRELLQRHGLNERCEVLFSPSFEQLSATDLADWILRDGLPVRMQMQLHKLLWGNQPGK